MDADYEEYEAASAEIRAENKLLMAEFTEWLTKKGLARKTIENHVAHATTYVDHYLLYEDAIEAAKGTGMLSMFFGWWFIKKCMWASPAAMRGMAASLKKFYAFMWDSDMITAAALKEVRDTIKEGMPEWVDVLERYDDSDLTLDEAWGI